MCASLLENFARQKLTNYAMQRDKDICQQFKNEVALYHSNMLIFVDDTGTDRTGVAIESLSTASGGTQ